MYNTRILNLEKHNLRSLPPLTLNAMDASSVIYAATITMTSQWTWWRLRSPASRLFTQPFIQTQIKENIKAPRHWPLCGDFTGTGEFPAQRASYAENVSIWWRHHYDICKIEILRRSLYFISTRRFHCLFNRPSINFKAISDALCAPALWLQKLPWHSYVTSASHYLNNCRESRPEPND